MFCFDPCAILRGFRTPPQEPAGSNAHSHTLVRVARTLDVTAGKIVDPAEIGIEGRPWRLCAREGCRP